MARFVNITDREKLREMLLALKPGTQPIWGKMTAQQMIEHMVSEVEWTNGKKICTCEMPAVEAERQKQKMIYTAAALPQNIVFAEPPRYNRFASIEAAIDGLMNELDDFVAYFNKPGITAVHGGFGPMTYEEWLIWHGKHFTHHLKQFGVI